MTVAIFISSDNVPVLNDKLKMCIRGFVMQAIIYLIQYMFIS